MACGSLYYVYLMVASRGASSLRVFLVYPSCVAVHGVFSVTLTAPTLAQSAFAEGLMLSRRKCWPAGRPVHGFARGASLAGASTAAARAVADTPAFEGAALGPRSICQEGGGPRRSDSHGAERNRRGERGSALLQRQWPSSGTQVRASHPLAQEEGDEERRSAGADTGGRQDGGREGGEGGGQGGDANRCLWQLCLAVGSSRAGADCSQQADLPQSAGRSAIEERFPSGGRMKRRGCSPHLAQFRRLAGRHRDGGSSLREGDHLFEMASKKKMR